MTVQRIYVHLIDGTDVYVPVNARQIQDAQYEIVDNKVYSEISTEELFQYFPGDVVKVAEHTSSDGTQRLTATSLISKGKWPDRNFSEFKYKAALRQLSLDKQTAQLFHDEIARIKIAHAAGHYFYPTIIETVNELDSLNSQQLG